MKKIILFILLISFYNCLFLQQQASAQDTTKTNEKRKNNAIKGSIAYFPILFNGIISIGYERFIAPNSSLSLTVKGYIYINDGGEGNSYSIIPNYNYYLSSKYKFINNTWINPCLIYTHIDKGGDDFKITTNSYGLGFSIGKRMNILHKKRLFFDIGFGAVYFKTIYKYYEDWVCQWNPSTNNYEYIAIKSHKPTYPWYPRFIFLLGYKF